MNTKEHEVMKMRGSADVSYLNHSVDEMIWEFMKEQEIPGMTLAIVQAPYIPRVVGYGLSDVGHRQHHVAGGSHLPGIHSRGRDTAV